MTSFGRDGHLDAIAWLQATLDRDAEGREAIARHCDVIALVDNLTAMHLALANVATNGHPQLYMDCLRASLTDYLATLEADQ